MAALDRYPGLSQPDDGLIPRLGGRAGQIGIARIEPLTSLRFFAAAYVVLYHTWPKVSGHPPGLLAFGFVSVSLFFVLSGYILAVVYLRRETPIDVGRFYLARFARIYPLFFATLLFGTPLLLLDRIHKYGLSVALAKTSVTFLGNCLMLQAWILQLFGIDNPNWSLAAEAFFYLLFPLVGVFLWRSCGSLRRAAGAMLVIYLGGIGLVQLSIASGAFSTDAITFNPLLHLSEFFSGVLFARMQMSMSDNAKIAIRRNAIWICAGSLVAFVAITQLGLPMGVLNDGLLIPVFLSLLLALCAGNQAIEWLLSRPWLMLLGESSYAIYLIHFPLFDYFTALHWPQSPVLYTAYLLSVLVLSIASYRLLETPARNAINRAFERVSERGANPIVVTQS